MSPRPPARPPRGKGSGGRSASKPAAPSQRRRQEQRSERPPQRFNERGLGGDQIEGRNAVRELLRAERRRVKEVWFAQGMTDADVLDEIADLCAEHRVPLRHVPRAKLDSTARSDSPQGVLAMAAPLPESSFEELLEQHGDIKPFLLAFDGVTDPHNLGSLIRTGECAGVTGIVLPKHRTVHVTPTVAKASAGAIEHVPMALVAGVPAAMSDCKEAGVWTVGLDMDGDVDIHDVTVSDQPVMLIFGAEGEGLSRLTKQRCDVLARIPQYGSVSSLNVAAAGAIACFEVARARS